MLFQARKFIAAVTLCALSSMTSVAEQRFQSAPRSTRVAAKVATLKAGDEISIVVVHGSERYGTFQAARQNEFTFHDIDRNLDVTFSYAEVKRVKNGYVGYNSATHTHTDRAKAYVAMGIGAGLIAGVIVAATVAKN